MAVLAKSISISALHRVNVMQHSDICIYLGDSRNLPLHTNLATVKHMLRKQLSMSSIVEHLERVERKTNAKISILLHTMATKM